MKYNLNLNLKALYETTPQIAGYVKEAHVLDYLILICGSQSKNVVKKRITRHDKEYTWVNYTHLMKELPVLNIKSKSTVTKILDKLTKLGYITTYSRVKGRKYVHLKELCHSLFFEGVPKKEQTRPLIDTPRSPQETNNTTIDNTTNITSELLNFLVEERGYSPSAWGKEMAASKKCLAIATLKQVKALIREMRLEPFWRTKLLEMPSVYKQLPKFLAKTKQKTKYKLKFRSDYTDEEWAKLQKRS